MSKHGVCPWWVGYLLASPIRRLWQDPARILAPHVREGATVFEPGPGMGFFTLELARLVGASGRVIAVDVEAKMIERLKRRAAKAGLLDRIEARVVPADSMLLEDLDGTVDFVFAFAVVHELPDAARFFVEAARAMKTGATLLLAEPAGHVSETEFANELASAAESGLNLIDRPSLRGCAVALLKKG
jgi:SAM-dependent methyltransferase